jgi:hypothetical protein
MRGGAQSHLIQANDGAFYVVKFINNPQHRRILVNEWLGSAILTYLGVATPRTAVVRVDADFLEANPEVAIQLGSRTQAVEPGWHFGSQFPGDPRRNVVYDFLPDSLLEKIENIHDFRATLVVDQWTSNADSRQAIFFRASVRQWLPGSAAAIAQMMDHGYLFEGPHWTLADSPLKGAYFRPVVYQGARSVDDFAPWIERIVHFPEDVIDEAVKQIPPSWLDGEEAAFSALLHRLMARRQRVPDLVLTAISSRK